MGTTPKETLSPKKKSASDKKNTVNGKAKDKKSTTTRKRTRKVSLKLDDFSVSQYLIQHPEFFIRNAHQIEQMYIPHPVRGVVSLPEWQLARQRARISQLESEITLLMEHASTNEMLFQQLMALQNQLLQANDLDELMHHLNRWVKTLGLSGAYLHLFDNKWQLAAPSRYQHYQLSDKKFNFIRVRHLQYSRYYLGQLNTTELDLLIPERIYIGSVALSLLGEFGDLGVLVFASHSAHHYQMGQGTLLLEKISELLPILISRWVSRK